MARVFMALFLLLAVLEITAAREHLGQLYLGNLGQSWIGRLPLPPR